MVSHTPLGARGLLVKLPVNDKVITRERLMKWEPSFFTSRQNCSARGQRQVRKVIERDSHGIETDSPQAHDSGLVSTTPGKVLINSKF